jgi:glycosyltransferase 2 family protein
VLWNRDIVFANRTLGMLGIFALAGCAAGFAGLVTVVVAGEAVLRLAQRLPPHLPGRGLVVSVAEVAAAHRHQGPRMFAAYAMSFPVHLLGIAMLLVCLHAADQSRAVPASLLLFAFPLGMLAIAVPITPAGIGVGQAAFYAVCNLALPGSGSAGANAFTIYQAVTIPVFLLGLIPYIAHRHELREE